jgi:hypothetical protein
MKVTVSAKGLKEDAHCPHYGVSVHLGEMAAESGAFCRRFLLLSHPR